MAIYSDKIWFAIKDEEDFEKVERYIFSSSAVPGLNIIEDNLSEIRAEYQSVVKNHPPFLPYFEENLSTPRGSWDTIPLITFDLRRRYRDYFPVLTSSLDKVPGLVGCFLSRLSGQSSIARHSGITNAIFRCQVGLELPSEDPHITGFCVAGTTTGLSCNKFIAFVDANVHWAWNNAPTERVILIVDIMRPQFRHLRYFMSCRIVLSYIILRSSQYRIMAPVRWFIRQRFSRTLINMGAIPLTPFFYIFVVIQRLLSWIKRSRAPKR